MILARGRERALFRENHIPVKIARSREKCNFLQKVLKCREINFSMKTRFPRPRFPVPPERDGASRTSDNGRCRIGPALTHAGGRATPSKRSAVRRRLRPPPHSNIGRDVRRVYKLIGTYVGEGVVSFAQGGNI